MRPERTWTGSVAFCLKTLGREGVTDRRTMTSGVPSPFKSPSGGGKAVK